MSALFPSQTSQDAEEGTASHWVASEALEKGNREFRGATAPNGIIVTEEMVEGAMVYVDAARAASAGCRTIVEKPLTVTPIHAECWGTPDLRYYAPHVAQLHVWDYKYGFGVVEPYENYQLITYAIGAIEELAQSMGSAYGIIDQTITVVLHIVQPRAFHASGPHRTWTVKGSDLRRYLNQLNAAAELATGPNPPTVPGTHCRYCSGRHACSALQQSAMLSVDYIGNSTPMELTPEAMSLELRTLQRASEMINFRLKALETQAIAKIEAGGTIPGWAIERGKGHFKWNKPVGEVFALGDLMGIDLRAPVQAITPADARKKRGTRGEVLPEELIRTYSAQPETGVKLVPWSQTLTARVFGGAAATPVRTGQL